MRVRFVVATMTVMGTILLTSACAPTTSTVPDGTVSTVEAPVSVTDAYNIGCPLIDATMASSDVVKKSAVWSLDKLEDNQDISQETRDWLTNAKQVVSATNPEDLPQEVIDTVVNGCNKNGSPISAFIE